MKNSKISHYIIAVLSIAIIAWFVLSYIDVVSNNLDPVPVYEAWNLFTLLLRWTK